MVEDKAEMTVLTLVVNLGSSMVGKKVAMMAEYWDTKTVACWAVQ